MIVPIQAATMGFIPGTPFSIAVHGLIRVGRGGGQARRVRSKRFGRIEIEDTYPVVDVSHLEVLISALTNDMKTLRGRIIDEVELRQVEEEILTLLGMLD